MSRLKKNPDKWIRKEVSARLNNIVVSSFTIPCVDTNVTGTNQPLRYIVMSTQTKADSQSTKCGWQWDCSILIDVITRYVGVGNTGSRVLINDIEERIILLMNNFQIEGGFQIDEEIHLESSDSMTGNLGDTETYFRQLMRYRMIVTEPFAA